VQPPRKHDNSIPIRDVAAHQPLIVCPRPPTLQLRHELGRHQRTSPLTHDCKQPGDATPMAAQPDAAPTSRAIASPAPPRDQHRPQRSRRTPANRSRLRARDKPTDATNTPCPQRQRALFFLSCCLQPLLQQPAHRSVEHRCPQACNRSQDATPERSATRLKKAEPPPTVPRPGTS